MRPQQAEHDAQLQELRTAHHRREKELSRRVGQLEEARAILLARAGAGVAPAAPAAPAAPTPAAPALLRIGMTLAYGPPHTVAAVHDLRDEAGVPQVQATPSPTRCTELRGPAAHVHTCLADRLYTETRPCMEE